MKIPEGLFERLEADELTTADLLTIKEAAGAGSDEYAWSDFLAEYGMEPGSGSRLSDQLIFLADRIKQLEADSPNALIGDSGDLATLVSLAADLTSIAAQLRETVLAVADLLLKE